MKRKITAVFCAAAIICTFSACGGNSAAVSSTADVSGAAQTEYNSQSLAGQVVSVGEEEITLLLGELSEGGAPMGEQPSGDAPQAPPENGGEDQPPEKPDGEVPAGSGESQPPEKPEGEAPDGNGGQPPEMPDGGAPGNGTAPSGFGGSQFTAGDETVTFTVAADAQKMLSELEKGDIVKVETNEAGEIVSLEKVEMGGGTPPNGQPGGFGGSGDVTQGAAANTLDSDGEYTGESYTSTGDDENALRVDGATVTLDGITVEKSAGTSSNTEDGDFYGQNAALLATNGANVTIKNATVTSSAQNGNGVFSYGEGTTVTISDSAITTTADNSGGIQTTGGGTTNASNLTVDTSGNSSAAIRSDRGGGTVNVDGGTYTSNGCNSPAVYSTADITVKNAALTAKNSEALVIEGKNSITLENCEVTGNMSDTKGSSSDENVHNVMIYQSMSGDAAVGTSTFSMAGGKLVSNNGDLFYITNTHCVIKLSGVEIVNKETDGYLMRVTGNSASHGWGAAGQNGAQAEFTADGQTLNGDVVVDSISTLNMTLTGNSSFTGTINIIDNGQGGMAVENNAVVTVDAGSTWTLTGDCILTSLTNNGTINFNGHTITLADGTVLKA